jgi:signal transduction histidine kinase
MAFIEAAKEASALLMRSLRSAAELVNSFKQVAVDQASAKRRSFNLLQASQEIVATIMNRIRKSGHRLELEMPDDIMLDSFPGPLGQVLINLINNALLHAFEGRQGGLMRMTAVRLGPDRVRLAFQDDGVGIPRENLDRIFDPFFTTKLGQGGNGLGLSITYNIVTSLLDGHIRVDSTEGEGTTFTIDLPLEASLSGE